MNIVDKIAGTLGDYIDYSLNVYDVLADDMKPALAEIIIDVVREATPHGECGDMEHSIIFASNDGSFVEVTVTNICWNRHDKTYYYIDMYEKPKLTYKKVDPILPTKGLIEEMMDQYGFTLDEKGLKLGMHNDPVDEDDELFQYKLGTNITLSECYELLSRLKSKNLSEGNVTFLVSI